MNQPIVIRDGEWETRIIPARGRLSWQWIVTNLTTKQQDTGRSSSEMFARHDARKALTAMRGTAEAA